MLTAKFEVERAATFKAKFLGDGALRAGLGEAVEVDHGMVPAYAGAYEVTPDSTEQVMGTAGKLMERDVTVHGVPYYETSNEFGTTVNIGG